jgi:hypothetical protein
VQLIIWGSKVRVCNSQVEGQVATDLPVISDIEESVILLETQFGIALCNDIDQRIIIHIVAERVKNIPAINEGEKDVGRLLAGPVYACLQRVLAQNVVPVVLRLLGVHYTALG